MTANIKSGPRERVLDGAAEAALRHSLRRVTVDDIASASGVSRATVYRHFTGGREEIILALVEREFAAFLEAVGAATAAATTLEETLVAALMCARELVDEHELLQRELSIEPDVIIPYLTVASEVLLEHIASFLSHRLVAFGWPATDVDDAAEHMARLVLSFVGASGSWDLADRADVTELVRTHFTAARGMGHSMNPDLVPPTGLL